MFSNFRTEVRSRELPVDARKTDRSILVRMTKPISCWSSHDWHVQLCCQRSTPVSASAVRFGSRAFRLAPTRLPRTCCAVHVASRHFLAHFPEISQIDDCVNLNRTHVQFISRKYAPLRQILKELNRIGLGHPSPQNTTQKSAQNAARAGIRKTVAALDRYWSFPARLSTHPLHFICGEPATHTVSTSFAEHTAAQRQVRLTDSTCLLR
jgi:hypothetical protein